MNDLLTRLLETYSNAWIAASLIALACSLVSVYVVLRRVAFIGIATAQIASAGVAFALLINVSPIPAAAVATLLGIALFAFGTEPVRVSREALVGVAFALASALSVLFVFRSSTELDHIEHIVYGSLLFASSSQVKVLAFGAAIVCGLHSLFGKEFLMVSFDRDTAQTLGIRTKLIDFVLFASIGAVIALSIGVAGSLLTFCLLVVPALIALLLAERLPAVFALSLGSGVGSAAIGVLLAILFDLPPGPTIVVSAVTVLAIAASFRAGPALGIGSLALTLSLLGYATWHAHAPAAEHSHSTPTSAADFHVDLELVVHQRSVQRGKRLQVDFATRMRGSLDGKDARDIALHLALELGSEIDSAKFDSVARAGHLELETKDLAPGKYTLSPSVWTGPPLDPTIDTRVLTEDELSANSVEIEIRP